MQEGHRSGDSYRYDGVRTWSKKFLGDTSPLDYDIIVFLRHVTGHWFTYVMFPKKKHLEAFDSMGYNPEFKEDFTDLWKWLNDDLRVHWGLEELLERKEWQFWASRDGLPKQLNGWDCGLYAIHFGFCFGLQASLSDITIERIDLYRQRLILYMLDGCSNRSIVITHPIWYEDFILESPMFRKECWRLHRNGVPKELVDVVGD